MKNIILLSVLSLFVFACNSPSNNSLENKTIAKDTVKLPLSSIDANGNYKLWYPGHKQVKISGRKNKKGKRVGIWKSYSEDGVELSMEIYVNGKRDGFTIVRYPNGVPRYTGNYSKDQKVGMWRFFDQSGKQTDSTNYSKK